MAEMDTAAPLDPSVKQMTGLGTVADLLSHLGADLALKCLRCEPRLHTKEHANRELISPILYAASVMAGNLLNSVFCATWTAEDQVLATSKWVCTTAEACNAAL